MTTDVCYCGHVRDEHEGGDSCAVEGCPCVAYEDDPAGMFADDEDDDA